MTWIGKILTILVMIAALVWMFLNVQTYVTRTNWYAEAKKYREGYDKAVAAREADYRASQADVDAIRKELESAKAQVQTLAGEVKTRDDSIAMLTKLNGDLNTANQELKTKHDQADANLGAAREQVAQLRKQNDDLETIRVDLVRKREAANTAKQQAVNEKNAALTRVDQLTKAHEDLQGRVYALQQNGGKSPSEVTIALAPKVRPLPENVRGTVTQVDGDLVTLSIGLDAGLTPGAVLDITRLTPEPKYLGKVRVTNTITPKQAVAQFQSASGLSVSQLRIDQRPTSGDYVGIVNR